ncbi:MAG: ABC transporter ATP-binding protein [Flavobacteriales bacterium]|nr:ABC transporter ATP-binding protein [Bacteroidota bacterium]MCB9241301.1 ABC transporter ATP-binding protein [Flavobacteriales bacterium]
MIELKKVSKRFGRVEVLRNIDFYVPQGRVISLLGPNGSGKSTLIKCILNLVRPSSGEIFINGASSTHFATRRDVSYMPQIARFAENITARQLFKLIGELRSLNCDPAELISYFDLLSHLDKPLGELSGGTRQKVNAVLAFLFDTPIIILDEPTAGLDPVSRVNFKQLVLREKANGKTILFTSHIMSDVEEVADEVGFLLDGKIVFKDEPRKLQDMTQQPNLEKAIASFIQSHKLHEIHS